MQLPSALEELVLKAWHRADRAMTKYPQPNYVTAKLAEEAGEVVQAYIHNAEGRGSDQAVEDEIVDCMAMLFRLRLEGDQVIDAAAEAMRK